MCAKSTTASVSRLAPGGRAETPADAAGCHPLGEWRFDKARSPCRRPSRPPRNDDDLGLRPPGTQSLKSFNESPCSGRTSSLEVDRAIDPRDWLVSDRARRRGVSKALVRRAPSRALRRSSSCRPRRTRYEAWGCALGLLPLFWSFLSPSPGTAMGFPPGRMPRGCDLGLEDLCFAALPWPFRPFALALRCPSPFSSSWARRS